MKKFNCNVKNNGYISKKKPELEDKIKLDVQNFYENMDDDFITDYFNRQLTIEEFDRIREKIISFQNDKFTISNFSYKPVVSINNQTKYNPYFLDNERKVLEKPIYLRFRCENCDSLFISRDLFKQKNKLKLLCQDCTLCNKTFKIRRTFNIKSQPLTYQSKLELKFIRYCNKNNILITDGPKISYVWKDIKRRYIVDFYIPSSKILVELKDIHIWHKQQLNNGKWESKMNGVKKAIEDGKYKHFFMINSKTFHKDIQVVLDKI